MKRVHLDETDKTEIAAVLDIASVILKNAGKKTQAQNLELMMGRVKNCDGTITREDATVALEACETIEPFLKELIQKCKQSERKEKKKLRLAVHRYKAILLSQLNVGYVKVAYRVETNFSPENRELVNKIIEIVEEYKRQGYRMTLRQLYYQLVSREIFANEQRNYAKLSGLLTDARMSGLIDWNFIEDRIRVPRMASEFESVETLIDAAIATYRRYRWDDQDNYVEVWVEKDALSGVLEPITEEYHVRLMVNRGYSSVSAMHDASLRFIAAQQRGKKCYLLYMGDHDPSGEDMVRDIRDRLREFWAAVEVRKLALTMEQIEEYNPPPNPAKMTDSRAAGYVAEHGAQSWELDALRPDVLEQILRDGLDELVDKEKYDKVIELEEGEKAKLQELKKEFYSKHFKNGSGTA